jgi:hypothetical protein
VVLPDDIKRNKTKKQNLFQQQQPQGTVAAAAATTPTATKGHSQVEHLNASNEEKKKNVGHFYQLDIVSSSYLLRGLA